MTSHLGRRILIVALTALTAAGEAAAATESKLKSVLFSDYYFPTENGDEAEIQQIATSYWLVFNTKFEERAHFRAVLAATVFSESNVRASTEPKLEMDLREAFATFQQPNSSLKIGQQIIPWGKADSVNPTDYLTAVDYTRLSPEVDVPRIGAPSFAWTWHPAVETLHCQQRVGSQCRKIRREQHTLPWTFDVIWTPVFPKSKVYNAVANLPESVTLLAPQPPKGTLGRSEGAVKIEYIGDSWDLAVSAFHGWNHLPQYTETNRGVDAAGDPTLEVTPRFSQITAGGVDFSTSLDDWVFVVEGAYMQTKNRRALDALTLPSRFETVVGVEREISRNLRFNGQVLWTYYPKYRNPRDEPDPVSREIAEANAILFRYQYRSLPGSTFRLTYDDQDSPWKFQFFAMNYFKGEDFFLQPKITHKWTDALSLTLGVDHYGGPGNHALSAQRSLNAVFTQVKYLF